MFKRKFHDCLGEASFVLGNGRGGVDGVRSNTSTLRGTVVDVVTDSEVSGLGWGRVFRSPFTVH